MPRCEGLSGPRQLVDSPCRALLRVWEVATEVEVGQCPHEVVIEDVVFSTDGKLLASAIRDGISHLWRWQLEDLIREACGRMTSKPPLSEWSKYLGEDPYHPSCPGPPGLGGIDNFYSYPTAIVKNHASSSCKTSILKITAEAVEKGISRSFLSRCLSP
ncbi:MAG: hypothetical protein WC560_11830 [Syntrophales bacterium]